MAVPGVVHQEIKARRSELGESVFLAFDKGAERCDVAGVQLYGDGFRSCVFRRGNDRLRVRSMRVIGEDRVDAASCKALNCATANSTTATGHNRNFLWGNCIRSCQNFSLHSGHTLTV